MCARACEQTNNNTWDTFHCVKIAHSEIPEESQLRLKNVKLIETIVGK